MSETKITPHMQSFVDKFVEFSARLANQVHLRSLRDAFATVMPIFILAGLAVLVNNVVFPWIFDGDTLTQFKVWGEAIINGTLNIAALLLAPMIAWSLAPGLFNINEPVIFGLPIVFNLPLMIPFVLLPAIGIYVAWLCTTLGLMSRCVVMIPWTTPPILSAWLATAGDWRAVVVQLAIIVFGVFFYLPFLKIAERVALKNSGIEN